MDAPQTLSLIEARLRAALQPIHLEITDDSTRHAGHAGAASGGGHFSVTLVAELFQGLGRVERHRLVYDQLRDLMPAQIHALAIRAIAPSEWTR